MKMDLIQYFDIEGGKTLNSMTCTHLYLLHGCQVLQLCVADLLLQHQLLEVLSCVWLPL